MAVAAWQGYVIAGLTSFLLGSGGSLVYSNAKIEALRQEMREEIKVLEDHRDEDMDILIGMSVGIARIEEQVRYIVKELDDR